MRKEESFAKHRWWGSGLKDHLPPETREGVMGHDEEEAGVACSKAEIPGG